MSGLFSDLLLDYRNQVERYRQRGFLNAAMAACALAATADGEVSFGERIRVDRILETLEQLKVFDPHEAVDLFDDFCQSIFSAPRKGHEAALAAVKTMTDAHPETAELIIRICLAIAGPRDDQALAEEIEIVMLCSILGVDPADTGLYVEDDPEAILRRHAPDGDRG